jgi:hypothetical protein
MSQQTSVQEAGRALRFPSPLSGYASRQREAYTSALLSESVTTMGTSATLSGSVGQTYVRRLLQSSALGIDRA